MKQIVIVAGGSPKYWPDISGYQPAETYWIGVDRGAWFLCQAGLTPDLAVGDFDSLSAAEFQHVSARVTNVQQAPAEKDETDTQLALGIANALGVDCPVILIGGTGGRLDHLLANFWLMMEPRFQSLMDRFVIKDNQNSVKFYQPGSYVIEREVDKKYVGFLCVSPVPDLTLIGLKYPLTKQKVPVPTSFASNEFVEGYANFEFSAGLIAVVQSKDQ